MEFLLIATCSLAGLIVGDIIGFDGSSAFGFFTGLGLGIVFVRLRRLSARIDALKSELEQMARQRLGSVELQNPPPVPVPVPVPASAPAAAAPMPRTAESLAEATVAARDFELDPSSLATAPPPPPPHSAPAEWTAPAAPAASTDGLAARLKRGLSEGNVPVKVGMLVLFAGVAALLKLAADEGWLRMPIELRLAGVALAAIAALAFGWRQRARRPSFGLALQGGAIGVLMLTVFAAFRIYHLMPAGAAFGLLLILVAGAGVLAVLQDALALAVLGILAGFAAPILISTGSGSHVVLFSYYSLLNLAIFAIAWRKPWRALNLMGFFFTYAIGTAWGVLRYEPAQFASTEPFLLLTFAIYLAIPILYARRGDASGRNIVDGTLVFGNPLFAFALQAALLDGARLPLAFCALGLAALYALLGWQLLRRNRVLGESFAVLGVGFATLAVPLALSARVSACTFALEGAALVWLGLRQKRLLPCIGGGALQVLAAGAFVVALAIGPIDNGWPVANGLYISAALIALAGFVSAWLLQRDGTRRQWGLLAYLWGLAWWVGAALNEIDRFAPTPLHAPALLAFAATTGLLAAFALRRIRAAALAWTAALSLSCGIPIVLVFAELGTRPFAGWSLPAFAVYAAAGWFSLRALREADAPIPAIAHIGWLWSWILAFGLALRQFSVDAQLGSGWHEAATLAPLLVALAAVLWRPMWIAPPLAARFSEYRATLLLSQTLLALLTFVGLLSHEGNASPLPYLPLINPVELGQLVILACFARWLGEANTPMLFTGQRSALLAVAAFAFVTAATLRAAHHLGGVPWDDGLWSSNLAQAALTVVWSILGVLGWIVGSRRGNRLLWLAGAVLMAVVLLKLLVIDRGRLGNLFGVVSFIAYGLLCTVIGYFAPAPPRQSVAPTQVSQ